jgi:hypothetical protein
VHRSSGWSHGSRRASPLSGSPRFATASSPGTGSICASRMRAPPSAKQAPRGRCCSASRWVARSRSLLPASRAWPACSAWRRGSPIAFRSRDIDLKTSEAMPRRGREGVVVVVPALTEDEQGNQPVIACLVAGAVVLAAEHVADRVDREGRVLVGEDADEARGVQKLGPRACEWPRGSRTDRPGSLGFPVDRRSSWSLRWCTRFSVA